MVTRNLILDTGDDRFRFLHPSMGHEPTGTFRDDSPEQHDAHAQDRSEPEAQPPSQIFRDNIWVQQHNDEECADCRSQPPAAVDRQVGTTAPARGDEFVDGGIDCRVFATDACAC